MSLLVTNSCTYINSVLAISLYIAPRMVVIAMDTSLSTQYFPFQILFYKFV